MTFRIIQDALWVVASLFFLVLFRFGFQNPFPENGRWKKHSTIWFYIYTATSYLTLIAALVDLSSIWKS